MNVQQMHKALGALIAQGHARKPVCINKDSFRHPLEADGAVILKVQSIKGPTWITMTDDDGGTKFNKDGTESGSFNIVLDGGAA